MEYVVRVGVMTPSPGPGGGLGLQLECNADPGGTVVDNMIRTTRVAALKTMQLVAGGLPEDGLKLIVQLTLPVGWENASRFKDELPRLVAKATSDVLEAELRERYLAKPILNAGGEPWPRSREERRV